MFGVFIELLGLQQGTIAEYSTQKGEFERNIVVKETICVP